MGFLRMYTYKVSNPEDNELIELAINWLVKMGLLEADAHGTVSRYAFTKFCILQVVKAVFEKLQKDREKLEQASPNFNNPLNEDELNELKPEAE